MSDDVPGLVCLIGSADSSREVAGAKVAETEAGAEVAAAEGVTSAKIGREDERGASVLGVAGDEGGNR